MSCTPPCLTCTNPNFYSCNSCDLTINSNSILTYSQCDSSPTWYIQLACTCMLFLFIGIPLIRKRSMVLTKIFDIIQMAAFFKYINSFIYYRHNLLYLDMRSFYPWSEGWQLFSLSSDQVIPIFLTEETHINKLVRIASIWAGTFLFVFLIGVFKICCREGKIQLSTYMSKNIKNTVCIAFYATVQDIAFYCANIFFNFNLNTTFSIIFFVIAILLSGTLLCLLIWHFWIVNYRYQQQKEDFLFNYQVMFMYRMDYDLFKTYSLTNLPQKQKKIFRYSNLAIIDIIKKIGFAFLISSYLYKTNISLQMEIYSILGYIIFFQLLWYIAMPFDPKKQVIQLIINIVADALLIAILILPIIQNSSSLDFIYFVMCLALFGLAIISIVIEIAFDLYTMIPYDLYNIGLVVVIEDKELQRELKNRKKQQEYNQRRIKQLKQQQQRLLQQLRQHKQNKPITPINRKQTIKTSKKQQESEEDINNHIDKNQNDEKHSQATNGKPLVYPIENDSQDGDEANRYKINTKKKRLVYQFNKKIPFAYSNKLDE